MISEMMTGEIESKAGGIQVIARAADVLRILARNSAGLSLAGIAKEADLARSTVQRIVQALEAEGFVESSGSAGGYQLGPALSELVYCRQIDIASEVRPHLERLSAELKETVALFTLSGSKLSAIDRCIPESLLRVVFPVGAIPHPAHELAPGRAILGELPEDQVRTILESTLPAEKVEKELATIEPQPEGARDTGVYIRGVCGFSVPLRTQFGVYALCAVLPDLRAEGREGIILSALQRSRVQIESKIGSDRFD
ncbi:IclR family transcriptional regulator [Pelagicoccus albus]|uniref:IclR family transcriptional regulator n=1 Tax=Pelagicoccus albus TaxID=415222 RepID=A0A7X1B7X0_9BACT|nr:IclR family transcriptional regulator [Pelagicoccus albus]MBC2607301.1 IclR family transcriptional regulator [Pelagicoccus albus]